MIKINFALKKQASALGTSKASHLSLIERLKSALGLKKSNLPVGAMSKTSATDIDLRKVLVPVGFAAVATFIADAMKADELAKLDEVLQGKRAEKSKLELELSKFKNLEQMKAQLENDEAVIRKKIVALQTLQTDRAGSFEALRVLADVIPQDTWLNQFKIENSQGQVQGASLTYQSVSDFMRRLEETPMFSEVQLKSTKQDTQASATLQQRATFELGFKRKESGGGISP